MQDFSMALAVYDFLPSLFTAAALGFLALMVSRTAPQQRWMAYLGGALVVLAGLLKALWKVNMASSGLDVVLLSEAMFPLMGSGFALVLAAIWSSLRAIDGKPVSRYPGIIVPGIIALTAAAAVYSTVIAGNERGYFPIFLGLASISNVALSVLLIRAALRREKRFVAFLFFLNIAMVFALQPIAAMPDKSIAIHWFEQTLTSGGAAAFALAGYLMLRDVTSSLSELPMILDSEINKQGERHEWAAAGGD